MHVLICGGGLGGLSLAQALRKQGISYEVFERDANKDSRFQGWALAIHGILDELKAAYPSDLPDMREATNHLAPLDLPCQICLYNPGHGRIGVEDTPEAPLIRSERLRLRNWLSTNIPIQWGKRVTSIENNDEGVSVKFDDGTSAKGDILVGADGINSVVREHLLQRPASEVLDVVPLAVIIGEVTVSGEAFKNQLEIGHSLYTYASPDGDFWIFGGLHHALPDGVSGRYYWMLMRPDPTVSKPDHWLQKATQEEKRDHVIKSVEKLPPRFQEIFKLTPASGIKKEPHVWRDIQLDSLPAGRVILMGDAAHAMAPFRGEGGFHTFIDSLELSKKLGQLKDNNDPKALEAAISEYNTEMLKRGVAAVKMSRGEQSAQQNIIKENGKSTVRVSQQVKPLPEKEVVLKMMNSKDRGEGNAISSAVPAPVASLKA